MLFKILHIKNMAQEAASNPQAFAEQQAKEAMIGAMIFPLVVFLGFLAFLFILAYTHLLGGPYGVAKFFFWIIGIIYATAGYVLYKIVTSLKRIVQKQREKMKETTISEGNYREAEIIKEE